MRFRKNVSAEHREFLQEQLKQYKKEMIMTKDELRELEKWVASGRSLILHIHLKEFLQYALFRSFHKFVTYHYPRYT